MKPHIYFNSSYGAWCVHKNKSSYPLFKLAMDFAVKLQDARNA